MWFRDNKFELNDDWNLWITEKFPPVAAANFSLKMLINCELSCSFNYLMDAAAFCVTCLTVLNVGVERWFELSTFLFIPIWTFFRHVLNFFHSAGSARKARLRQMVNEAYEVCRNKFWSHQHEEKFCSRLLLTAVRWTFWLVSQSSLEFKKNYRWRQQNKKQGNNSAHDSANVKCATTSHHQRLHLTTFIWLSAERIDAFVNLQKRPRCQRSTRAKTAKNTKRKNAKHFFWEVLIRQSCLC